MAVWRIRIIWMLDTDPDSGFEKNRCGSESRPNFHTDTDKNDPDPGKTNPGKSYTFDFLNTHFLIHCVLTLHLTITFL